MRRLKKIYSIMLLFFPIAYVHGNYEYIEIVNHEGDQVLILKESIYFDLNKESEKNELIISEIINSLENDDIKILYLKSKKLNSDVLTLLTNALININPKNKNLMEINLASNYIGNLNNELKDFLRELSKNFKLIYTIDLSNNQIGGFLEIILNEFITSQKNLQILNFRENNIQRSMETLFNLFEGLKSCKKFKELKFEKTATIFKQDEMNQMKKKFLSHYSDKGETVYEEAKAFIEKIIM